MKTTVIYNKIITMIDILMTYCTASFYSGISGQFLKIFPVKILIQATCYTLDP